MSFSGICPNRFPLSPTRTQQAPGCEIDDVMDFEVVARAASTTAATTSTAQPQQHPPADFFYPTVGVEIPSLNLDDISRPHESPTLNLDCFGDPSSCLETLSDVAMPPTSFPMGYQHCNNGGDNDNNSVHPLQTAADKYDAPREYTNGGGQSASMSAGFSDGERKRQVRWPAATTGASCFEKNSGGERVDRFRLPATAQHNNTRAARNGREQQRAQKISDMIDKLKVGYVCRSVESVFFPSGAVLATPRAPCRTTCYTVRCRYIVVL